MKMTTTHYETLRVLIESKLAQHPDVPTRYANGEFPRADSVKDVNKRMRWDLFWASTDLGFRAELRYLQNSHIDTALRRIVKPIERNF